MKKMVIRITTIFLAIALLFSFTACGTNEPAKATTSSTTTTTATVEPMKDITLTVWHSAFTSANEKDMAEDQWQINKFFQQFEDENPGVTIDSVYQADQQVA